MKIKGLIDECFTDYKAPAMLVACNSCSFKCDIENGCQVCQNSKLANDPSIEIEVKALARRFAENSITRAVIFGGLEPLDQIQDILEFVCYLRQELNLDSPVIIYTGYTEEEVLHGALPTGITDVARLLSQKNLVVKYGRFKPNQQSHFDEVLGVNLASANQYAKEYNFEYST